MSPRVRRVADSQRRVHHATHLRPQITSPRRAARSVDEVVDVVRRRWCPGRVSATSASCAVHVLHRWLVRNSSTLKTRALPKTASHARRWLREAPPPPRPGWPMEASPKAITVRDSMPVVPSSARPRRTLRQKPISERSYARHERKRSRDHRLCLRSSHRRGEWVSRTSRYPGRRGRKGGGRLVARRTARAATHTTPCSASPPPPPPTPRTVVRCRLGSAVRHSGERVVLGLCETVPPGPPLLGAARLGLVLALDARVVPRAPLAARQQLDEVRRLVPGVHGDDSNAVEGSEASCVGSAHDVPRNASSSAAHGARGLRWSRARRGGGARA